jgi:arylsulfatase A-like enzyme
VIRFEARASARCASIDYNAVMCLRNFLLALVPLLASLLCGCTESPPPPHLLLITSDALRADHLSGTGYPRVTSPNLDAFAEGAWDFTQAITTIPKTGPAFTTMFTGLHPQEHGVGHNDKMIPPQLSMLAEEMKAAGYRTAAFVGNPALRPTVGFSRGFDVYVEVAAKGGPRAVNGAFLHWARQEWEQPTFVWIHYFDPHGPYDPAARYEALFLGDKWAQSDERVPLDFVVQEGGHPNKVLDALPAYHHREDGEDRVARFLARYDAQVREMDDAFGKVLGFLHSRGLFDPSAIIFTSDHGESLGEHGFYFEHGWFAFEPTLHVPLFIKEAGQVEGRRVEELVSHLDFLPTICGLVDLDTPNAGRGRDLFAERGEGPPVVIENSDRYPVKFHGLRTSQWKYLVSEGDGTEELYDLLADPEETKDVAGEHPEQLASLRAQFESSLESLRNAAVEDAGDAVDDEATRRALEAIGYGGR